MKIVIGKNIARWRKFVGLTQVNLAERVGVTVGQIGRYERAEDNIFAVRLYAICEVLGVPIADMFKGMVIENVTITGSPSNAVVLDSVKSELVGEIEKPIDTKFKREPRC